MAEASPKNGPAEMNFSGTLLETDEDIRKVLLAAKQGIPIAVPVARQIGGVPPVPEKPADSFRPTIRPASCTLTVFDDGKAEGENIRVRSARFVIGRTQGDLLLPLDEQVSSQHVEITLQVVEGERRWVVTDLQSTNGLFVRVSRTVLQDKSEFLIGKGRYRFEQAGLQSDPTVDHAAYEGEATGTQAWGGNLPVPQGPSLVEVLPGGTGNRMMLRNAEYWIGTHPSCGIGRPDDPFTDARHARVFRDAKKAWNVQNNKSLNGLWFKMSQLIVDEGCMFQIGEQRFRLKVGGV